MSETKLEPCPFCGAPNPAMHPNDIAPGGAAMAIDGSTAQYAHCDGCGAEGPQSFHYREAVANWNCRYPSRSAILEEAAKERDRLRDALEKIAAPWDSGQTTVPAVFPLLSVEFQRRMDIAGEALAALSTKEKGDE